MDQANDLAAPAAHDRWPDRVRLPLELDVVVLNADLAEFVDADWRHHFVRQNYTGDWDVLPLRAKEGATHPVQMIYADPMATVFVDTPLLDRAPHLRAVLAALECPVLAARLMRLAPGSTILEHSDHDLDAACGRARLHIPVTTNDDVVFLLNRVPVDMAHGSVWYLRLADPHSVHNGGTTDRVHLVIDVLVDDWLTAQLDAGTG
jgi:Aspartyl/Asparaginyl beta-hydroxylase